MFLIKKLETLIYRAPQPEWDRSMLTKTVILTILILLNNSKISIFKISELEVLKVKNLIRELLILEGKIFKDLIWEELPILKLLPRM